MFSACCLAKPLPEAEPEFCTPAEAEAKKIYAELGKLHQDKIASKAYQDAVEAKKAKEFDAWLASTCRGLGNCCLDNGA